MWEFYTVLDDDLTGATNAEGVCCAGPAGEGQEAGDDRQGDGERQAEGSCCASADASFDEAPSGAACRR